MFFLSDIVSHGSKHQASFYASFRWGTKDAENRSVNCNLQMLSIFRSKYSNFSGNSTFLLKKNVNHETKMGEKNAEMSELRGDSI